MALMRNTLPSPKPFYLSPLFPPLVMACIFVIALFLAQSLKTQEKKQMLAEATRTAKYIEDEVYTELEAYSSAIIRMAARWSIEGVPTKAEWEQDAKMYVRHFPGMSAVKWIDPLMRIKWFVPYVGNEHLTQLDLSAFKEIEHSLSWAKKRNRPTLTESMTLVRGGQGFYVFVPFKVQGEFYGYLGAMIRSQKFFEQSLANIAPHYLIEIEDANGSVLFKREFEEGSRGFNVEVDRVFSLSNGASWRLKVSLREDLINDAYSFLPLLVFVLGIFLSLLMGWALSNWQKAIRRASRIQYFNKQLKEEMSERKLAETALAESEKRFRELVENIKEVFWVQDTLGKRILYLSPACAAIWGREPEYYYQNPSAWFTSIHSEDRKAVCRALEVGRGSHTVNLEFRIVTPNGEVRWIRDRSVLMFEGGRAVRRIGISEDVTARKKIEEKVTELNQAFESALEGVLRLGVSGEILTANEALSQMFGEPFVNLRDLPWGKLFRTQDWLKLRRAYDQMLAHGKASAEVVGVRKNALREEFDAQIVLVKCKDQLGRFKGFYCFVSDISEKRHRESVEEKSKFISMVSHELRTPLHAVKEGIEIVLEDTQYLNEDQQEMLQISKRNVTRLSRMINDVLDFQKLEAGAVKLNLAVNSMNDILVELKETMQPLARAKGLCLRLELDESVPELLLDSDRITQVLVNLVSNAIKFTDFGTVTLRSCWKRELQQVFVEVEDTGVGIQDGDVAKIFTTFGQAGQGPTRGEKGTGLGLAITKKIVEQHHGKIECSSQPGKGSTFRVELPYYGASTQAPKRIVSLKG